MRLVVLLNVIIRNLNVFHELRGVQSNHSREKLAVSALVLAFAFAFRNRHTGGDQIFDPVQGKGIRNNFLDLAFIHSIGRERILDKLVIFFLIESGGTAKCRYIANEIGNFRRGGPDPELFGLVSQDDQIDRKNRISLVAVIAIAHSRCQILDETLHAKRQGQIV